MEFKLEVACPTRVEYANAARQRVVILPLANGQKVLASGSLMKPQIDAVVAAHAKGLKSVDVPSGVLWS